MKLNQKLDLSLVFANESVPFQDYKDEEFESLVDEAIRVAKDRLEIICKNSAEPTFQNTLEGIEFASNELDFVARLFSNFLSAKTSEVLQKSAPLILPKLAGFSNDVFLNPELFVRVKKVFQKRSEMQLTIEQSRILELTYQSFVRNGAELTEEKKKRLREIDEKISIIGQEFSDRALKETQEFELVLDDSRQLKGLPDSVIAAASEAAKKRGKPGKWVFTLDFPSVRPFLQYAQDRELRKKLWFAQSSKCLSGANSNAAAVISIASLRLDRAKLLGFENHADFVLKERMASSATTVLSFLDKILNAALPAGKKDVEELQQFSGLGQDLKPWDISFYSEKLRMEKYSIDDEVLKPYFEINQVWKGAFEIASKLYGIDFKKRNDLKGYHPEVEVFEVRKRGSDSRHVGHLYVDNHPREGKRAGAWMTSYREAGAYGETGYRPWVSVVCNMTRPTQAGEKEIPALLALDSVRTIFHELGHALHGLLSQCHYRSVGGTNVFWDFVELPSQFNENFAKSPEGLRLFAKHFETGEPMPEVLISKIVESSRFQAGLQTLRQLSFGFLDMAWHTLNQIPGDIGVESFEAAAISKAQILDRVSGTSISSGFSHIFSGGYSSGYYSYKWAEVLEADAFDFFKENGIFDEKTAAAFRTEILEKGGSEDPMLLYRRFRGKNPDPEALLKRDGLL